MHPGTRRVITPALIAVLLAGLVACGTTPGGNGNGGAGVRDVGLVIVDEHTMEGAPMVTGSGVFVRFDEGVPPALFDTVWGGSVGTCALVGPPDLSPPDPSDMLPGIPLPDDVGITFLGAGDTITVRSDGTAYLEFERFQETIGAFTLIAYYPEAVAGPLPGALALRVPGDAFPAVASAAFPDTSALILTAPDNPGASSAVSIDTTFTWSDATNDAATVVSIDLVSNDDTTLVHCVAADTGTFAFPSVTVSELGGTFTGKVTSIARTTTRVQEVGDARLVLAVSRSTRYGFVKIPIIMVR